MWLYCYNLTVQYWLYFHYFSILATSPYANVVGTWKGNVYYAVPDIYGGCVSGSCSSEITFSADGQVSTTWPADCQPGMGTTVSNINPSQYDGTFYQNSGTNKCIRMIYAGNNLYLTQAQVLLNL